MRSASRNSALARLTLLPVLLVPARALATPSAESASAAVPSAAVPSATAPSTAAPAAGATAQPPAPAEVPMRWKVWPLFDPKVSPREGAWFVGPSSLRDIGTNTHHLGVAFGRASTIIQRRGPLWLSIQQEWGLRIYSPWTIIPVMRYVYEGGFHAGPFELGGGVSLMPFSVDFTHGRFGVDGPSPGASARIGLKFGGIRVSVRVEREYLWRLAGQKSQVFPPTGASLLEALRFWHWVGQDDALMTGIVLEIAGEQPKTLTSGGHPLVFVK